MKKRNEEEQLIYEFENDEWLKVEEKTEEIARYRQIASATVTKNKRINIRLSEKDLEMLKIRAIEEGIPYQTLITHIIHKYIYK
ncbi:MAG: hypothetical protein L6Q59_09760 [Ignavibacteriaceae bacterium]|nr:hypothetical protein [Ignavibacteriaceae bacterium]